MHQYRRSTVFVLAVFLIALVADVSRASPADEPALPGGVMVTVKTGSIKELSDRIMAIARRIEPGPQVEAMPFMLGAMLGDPMLQGVESGSNMGLAMVKYEADYHPVLLARLGAESPYRRSLPGYGFSLSDYGGWTFGTAAPLTADALGEIRGDLIAWVEADRDHDVEVRLNGPEVSRFMLANEARIREELRTGVPGGALGDYEEAVWSVLKTLAGEFRVASSIGFSLELGAGAVTQHGFVEAAEDTAMGRFFSADHTVSTAIAEWFDAGQPFLFVGRTQPGALSDYVDYFSAKAETGGGEQTRELFDALRSLIHPYVEASDGHTAGFFRFEGMNPKMVQIADSRYDDDGLRAALEAAVDLMNHSLVERFSGDPAGGLRTRTELVREEQTIGDHRVYAIRTQAEPQGDDVSEAERRFYADMYDQVIYYVQVGGHLVMAYDYDDLLTTVMAIDSGEKPEPNAATLFREEPGLAAQWIVNSGPLLSAVRAFMAPGDDVSTDLPPARGELWLRANAARGKFEIPVELIAGAYREVKAMSEAMGPPAFDFEGEFEIEEPEP